MMKMAEPLNIPLMSQSIRVGPSIPKPRESETYQIGDFQGGQPRRLTLTSSSFSRISFSVSGSVPGGTAGIGKSVPLSLVSLLKGGGEEGSKVGGTPAPTCVKPGACRVIRWGLGIPQASSVLAPGHTCDSVPSLLAGSCSGCTVPCSSHSVSLGSHPLGPACGYAPASSST